MISERKNIFKDFSSGEGGGPVALAMKYPPGREFRVAIEWLADLMNITLEFEEERPGEEEKRAQVDEVYKILRATNKRYKQNLQELAADHPAKKYVLERFTEEDVLLWGIGYAPLDNQITKLAKETGTLANGLLAGVIKQGEQGSVYYDSFKHRITFPILDHRGRVVSFGGRLIPSEPNPKNYPKYLNGRETMVYNKSQVLYGLNMVLQSKTRDKYLFLVEGYTDTIAMHRHGMERTAASCGTALTDDHAKLISRYTDHVILLRDGDEAGQKAAEKDLLILLKYEIRVDVIVLPEGEDPETFMNQFSEHTQLETA